MIARKSIASRSGPSAIAKPAPGQTRGPVLKGLTNSLLRRRKAVLAFTSARPNDGGTGAVYVLLKKLKPVQGSADGTELSAADDDNQ